MFYSDTLHDILLPATWLHWSHALHVQEISFQLNFFYQVAVGGLQHWLGQLRKLYVAFLHIKCHRTVWVASKACFVPRTHKATQALVPCLSQWCSHIPPSANSSRLLNPSHSVGSLPQCCHTLPLPTPPNSWIPLTPPWLYHLCMHGGRAAAQSIPWAMAHWQCF